MSDGTRNGEAEPSEVRAGRFQYEFDRLLLGLLAAGFVIALLYGASAGICPPTPQRASAVAEVSVRATSRPATVRPATPEQAAESALGHIAENAASAAIRRSVAGPSSACVDGNRVGWLIGILLALSMALAALAVGAFIGFLFGLPRSLTSSDFRAAVEVKAAHQAQAAHEAQGAEQQKPQAGAPAERPVSGQASDVNTNLEKISDWLTTIIVGVGLTKLQDIPGGIEAFGDRVEPFFGYGGKLFGIAGGLFFLIGGFFLAYVGTRVKLSLIFLLSQLLHRNAAELQLYQAVQTALHADLDLSQTGASRTDELKKADEELLKKSLSDLKSPEEVLAWAMAKARAGDFASALAAYRDVISRLPLTEKLQTDYAQVLAAAGDTVGANNVVASLATISPDAEREARQKVAAAAQAGQTAAMRTRLQQGLYKAPAERGYEDSIAAGEQLLALSELPHDAWVHVWLAAAYGQKHAAETVTADEPPTGAQQEMLDLLRSKVVDQVRKALKLDPRVKPILRGMYDPALRIGNDDDLDSLRPDEVLDSLLLDNPPGQ